MISKSYIKKSIALVAALGLVLTGCASEGESADGGDKVENTKLTVYSAEVTADFWVDKFKEKHNDYVVDVLSASSGESIARTVAERERPRGDVLAAGGDPEGQNPGLLRKNSNINLDNVDPDFIDPNGFNTPMMKTPVIFIYNAEALNGDAVPSTWADLADPKWKNRIQMGNPLTSEAAYKAMVTWWSIGGWDLVDAIASNVIVTAGSGDAMPSVSNGEAAIGVGLEQLVYQWVDGDLVKAGYPTDGVIFHAGSWFLINNSPNPEGADMFISSILDPEAQQEMSIKYPGMRPILTTVDGNPDLPAIGELNRLPFPKEATDQRSEFNSKWEEIITSK